MLCITLVLVACSSALKLAAIPAGVTALMLGGSLSYGTGATEGQDHPSLLAQYSGWDIVNAGMPDNISAQGLAGLPDLLDEHQPALLMIKLGDNDFLRKIALSEKEANLRAIIQAVKLKRIPTVLIAIPDYQPAKAAFGDLDDHPLHARLAEEMQTTLVANMFSTVLSTDVLKAGYVHPNTADHQVVADNLRESLEGLGLLAE